MNIMSFWHIKYIFHYFLILDKLSLVGRCNANYFNHFHIVSVLFWQSRFPIVTLQPVCIREFRTACNSSLSRVNGNWWLVAIELFRPYPASFDF